MIEIEKIELLEASQGRIPIVAGPCSAESENQVLDCARSLAALGIKVFRAGVWKPRTRPGNFEGAGTPALEWLRKVKSETGMAVTTEVANTRHVEAALKAGIDILWIGARTTTSPFAVQEIADALRGTDIPVLVKNPINAELELWIGAFERLSEAGLKRLAAIHRGFSSYNERIYRYSPEWQIPIELRRRIPGLPVICDPSHMAGRSELVPHLAQMALDMKADGLFIEAHPNPAQALSDRAQQLTPEQLAELTGKLVFHRDPEPADTAFMEPYRSKLEEVDLKLIQDLAERFRITGSIGEYKNLNNLAILQPDRYNSISDELVNEGLKFGLDEKFIRLLFETIHAESIRCQINKKNNT
ncbi:MAG: bifunctional 3-deoxy-7-phosphoheptulonate synthase/chorismate mutase type II [Bacteroidaceae bacterium]|nr:bifunctional 3-deoxy-7-phosphoheptulonate synthase/chorismate mutase type II [Bacteroidaceae bacterium]